jgi:hypothetical protein
MAIPTIFTGLPTPVYTGVLDPGSSATADLAWLAFGAVLWGVLIVKNRGAFNGSTKPSAIRAVHHPTSPVDPD